MSVLDEAVGRGALTKEAVVFLLDLGVCPGGACPHARGGCGPWCPALQAWVEEVSGG